ncbi:Vesicle trafficking between the ER and Golgi, partial [Bonamia ostreae]
AVSKMVNDYRKIQEDFRSQPKNRSQNPNLLETISDLPKIQRQKILTDRHTAVASALSKKLSRRRLAEFFLVEENLIQGKKLNLKKAKSLLSSETPTTNDKLRLLLIYLIKNPTNIESFEQIAEIYFEGLKNKKQITEQNEIAKSGKAISSIKKLLFIDDDNENNNNDNNKLEKNSLKTKPENPINPITNGNDNDQNTFISKFFRKGGINMINSKATELTENLWKNVVDKSAQIFAEVKNMLPTSKLSPLSRIVDEITTNRLSARKENGFLSFSENDEKAISNNKKVAFATIDPQVLEKEKNFGTSFGTRFGREKVIVFVVGGGSYVEFQNLEDFANGKFGVSEFGFGGDGVLYGATEMVAPEDFLVDLENCFVE